MNLRGYIAFCCSRVWKHSQDRFCLECREYLNAALVPDYPRSLKLACNIRDRGAAHSQHFRKKFLGSVTVLPPVNSLVCGLNFLHAVTLGRWACRGGLLVLSIEPSPRTKAEPEQPLLVSSCDPNLLMEPTCFNSPFDFRFRAAAVSGRQSGST
jgi:hypothetical protein